jgi:rod shape-determining protein MreC
MGHFLVFLRQYRYGLSAMALLTLALILLMFLGRTGTLGGQHPSPLIQRTVIDLLGPAQRLLAAPVAIYRNASERITTLWTLEDAYYRAKSELERRKPALIRLQELEQENRRLRALLNMRPDPLFHTVFARVIGDSSSAFARAFVLDVGEEDGIQIDTPVVGAAGLVGRIVRTFSRTSHALSLQDINSRVPVLVQRSRARGIVSGTNNRLLSLEYFSKDSDIRIGDLLLTSGMGGVFPKGLPVGQAISVAPHEEGLFLKVTIRPMVDIDRTEEVRLLLPNPLPPPPPELPEPTP